MKQKVGIYCLQNKKNGKRYVGSSNNLEHRLLIHLSQLENDIHSNRRLQEAFDNDGLDFCILEYLPDNASKEEILNCEQKWINMYQSTNPTFGYNKINSAQTPYTSFTRRSVKGKRHGKAFNIINEIAKCHPILNRIWRIVKAIIE